VAVIDENFDSATGEGALYRGVRFLRHQAPGALVFDIPGLALQGQHNARDTLDIGGDKNLHSDSAASALNRCHIAA
jgi:hypothetical protein